MNQELWDKISEFDFDTPPGDYGFSIRLANENFWTKEFTSQAIVEYKKFMYLATVSDFMVSPSGIVDTVWHQHLIFTQSYDDFCNLIGKKIQHVPSTHNKEDYERFMQAKKRTTELYMEVFGKQPNTIWEYPGMFDSLNLEKSGFKIRSFLIFGMFAFFLLSVPAYFLLKPLYTAIQNPNFLVGFVLLTIITFVGLERYNRQKLIRITQSFDKNSFVYQLLPLELVYLKTQKLSHVINGVVNELIDNKTITVNADNAIYLSEPYTIRSKEQLQVVEVLEGFQKIFYPTLLKHLLQKPVFTNIAKSMDAFQKYLNKSKQFGKLFYANFSVLAVLLLFGFTRLMTGIVREKPVVQISIGCLVLLILIILYLNRLTKLISLQTIPNIYITRILTRQEIEENWQWRYFLFGTTALTAAFLPLANYIDKNSSSFSSCGTSCGSSCGSSCGGCGGD